MIRSMTAFASAETETRWGALAFELRSVNHRYLELNPRLPEELRAIEPALRERVAAKLTRGKVDVNLRFRPADAGASVTPRSAETRSMAVSTWCTRWSIRGWALAKKRTDSSWK